MDLTPTIGTDIQTPPTKPKSLSFINATLKPHSTTTTTVPPPSSTVVSYKACLKNHAASIGGHALDGCGEFMPSSSTNPTDPRSLKCAACGCHRNFHRREPQEQPPSTPTFLTCFYSTTPSSVTPTVPARQQPLPQLSHRAMTPSTSPSLTSSPSHSHSPMSSTPSSPPPLSHLPPSSYPAPHMLLAFGNNNNNNNAYSIDHQNRNFHSSSLVLKTETINLGCKKRYRTKFNQEQKEKMYSFSEKLGWRMQKGDDGSVQEFCNEIGVPRGVFKVWMHNNKNTSRKKSENANPQIGNNNGGSEDVNGNGDGINNSFNINSNSNNDIQKNEDNCVDVHVSFNALSS
ncbi:putative transcription factor ZF-HD family [Lupinus albus]|uniref:Putative transcription factor ZF-HD family n=1 Tax=Lupinus albus TaxID=3870 RepID=A0A6A4PBE6_LUPAL|nr:putative transcription factor ZF-HD family [Lupinus albus]